MGVAPRSGRGVSICIICHHLCVIMRHSYATEFGTVMSAEGSPEGIHERVESGTTAGTKAFRLSARSFLSSGFVIHICFNTVRCAVPSHAALRCSSLTSSSLAQYARPRRRGLAISAISLTLASLSRIRTAFNCSASPRLPRCLSSRCRLLFVPFRTRRTS